ncbi:helix-turn-helix domain-containing protein [Candidatus Woesearchaeota archaeon]|nr:helix-turn-helix domain-containing protein [Candidatus Woesearchaeota archaeon]
MSLTEAQRFHLKKFIKELENFRGRHTELVSVYIPQDYDLNKIVNHLAQEQGTASNIKSASTRKNVTDALERMIQHLKLFKRTPPNGLVVFSGNVAEREGQQDFKVWSIEPPVPLKTRIYRCDKEFVLDILRDMLDVKEVYGLVVMDRRDANIALLKGKTIIPLVKTHSEVPGKFKAGGQCLVKGTLIQSSDGLVLPIENSHNPLYLKSLVQDNLSIGDSAIINKWDINKQEVYKIITTAPRLEVESSKDHLFFVLTADSIVEKAAEDLKIGDYLIMPEKINVEGAEQHINSKRHYNSFIISKEGQKLLNQKRLDKKLLQRQLAKKINVAQTTISSYEIGKLHIDRNVLKLLCEELEVGFDDFLKKYTKEYGHQNVDVKLPEKLTPDFAQFIGYLIGDGSMEIDRITFSEQKGDVALCYKKKFEEYFNFNISYRFRQDKNYHQLRITSRPLVRLIKDEFPEIKKTLDTEVPEKILKSKDDVVSGFLKGLFDAEGYVSSKLAIGMNNKRLIQQTQMTLLRFGVLSSILEYDNRRNPYSKKSRFTLEISDKESLSLFERHIGFSSKSKSEKLKNKIKSAKNISRVRQVITSGRNIGRLLRKYGHTTHEFRAPSFFTNKRMISKVVFYNRFIPRITNSELKSEMLRIYNSKILPVKILKIEVKQQNAEMVDISVMNQNFIANGVFVHNSAMRFSRQIEGAAKDHYKKVAEYMKETFLKMEGLKGIIVGGPGPTKYDLVEGDFITNEVKKKIIAIKDLSYTGEFGLEELLEKSQDVLAQEDVTEEKKIVSKFLETLATKQNMVSYGETDVMNKLKMGVVDILLLSEDLSDEKIEEFEAAAKAFGTNVRIISTQTREGVQLRDLGKAAAILRYEVHT